MNHRYPDSAIEIVRQLVDDEDRACWGIGDIINELSAELGHPVAVVSRHLAYETGGNDHTFRDYAYVAGRVAPVYRARYPLTRHQWKACLSAPDYLEVAKWAVDQADENGGRPMSVRAIRAHVAGVDPATWAAQYEEASMYIERYVTRVTYILTDGAHDERNPEWFRDLCNRMLKELEAESSERIARVRF